MLDTQTGAKLQSWKGHIVHDLLVSHDGRYLISTTSERKVNMHTLPLPSLLSFWSMFAAVQLCSLSVPRPAQIVGCAMFCSHKALSLASKL